jgi:hypothetical protein
VERCLYGEDLNTCMVNKYYASFLLEKTGLDQVTKKSGVNLGIA